MLTTILIVLAVLCLATPFAVLDFGPSVRRGLTLARQSELFPFDMLAGLLALAALISLAF